MKIHLTTVCWNEEEILPSFLEHYFKNGVDHITVYDNYSTDKSVEICKSYKNVTVIEYDSNNQIRDDVYLQIKNEEWKKNPGNWNIIVDCDEFLTVHEKYAHKEEPLRNQLLTFKRKGNLLPRVIGVNIVSENLENEHNPNVFVLDPSFNKRCVFTPKLVPIFKPGCHNFTLNAEIRKDKLQEMINNKDCSPLFLYHNKYINTDKVVERFKIMRHRLSEYNIKNNYGTQYLKDEESIRATVEYMKRFAMTKEELMSKHA